MLMALETEKEERAKRQRNVIITDLVPEEGVNDEVIFERFCNEHLTVKPHPVSSRRVGKPAEGRPMKLRITLENSQSVNDLIESSAILRHSTNNSVKKVYFNRDQTKMERQAGFEQREQRRAAALNPGVSGTLQASF
jgi:hypothetical protein